MQWKWRLLVISAIVAAGLTGGARTLAQPAADAAVADVRKMAADARKDLDSYKAGGGAPDGAENPAVKWSAALWDLHQRSPQSEAGAIAAAEAVRLLVRAELWERAHSRVESVDFDNPAWERLATPIYEEGIARKDLQYTIDTLSRAAASTTKPSIRSAVLLTLGRTYRRHGDNAAATRSLEAARSATPGTPQAEEADGLLYEIAHLSVGLPAPPIAARARSGRAINLAAFRGKPVVLVFWGTT